MKYQLLAGLAFFAMSLSYSQPLTMVLPDTSAVSGDSLDLELRVRDFSRIVSMDFSIAWNPEVLEYLSFSKGDLSNTALGSTSSANGILRFSWFDINGIGQTLADNSAIVRLQFRVSGNPGDSTLIRIQNEPLPIEIVQATTASADKHEAIDLDAKPGVVRLLKPLNVGWTVRPATCYGAEDGGIQLQVPQELIDTDLTWKGPGDFTASGASLSGLQAGNYTFEFRDTDGTLMYRGDVSVTEPGSAPEIMDITMEEKPCEVQPASVSWSVRGGVPPYQFRIGNKIMTDTFLVAMESGNYTLQVADANNCATEKAFEIEASHIPVFDLGGEQAICGDQGLTLSPGTGFKSYEWSTGATEAAITIVEPGTYSLTITNEYDCSYADTVEVLTAQTPQVNVTDTFWQICPGESVALTVSGASEYTWIDTSATLNQSNTSEVLAAPVYSSLYSVIGTNACGADTAAVMVELFPIAADAGPDTCIVEGTTIQLQADGALSYFWLPAAYPVSDPAIANPVIQALETTTYKVVMIDENGCVIRDSVVVEVLDSDIELPRISLITPNGDGKNDVLFFPKAEKYGNNVLRVFNRWGNIVYQKINYQWDDERFDGTYKGSPLPDGNYFYVLAFRNKQIKQTLTILRN